MSSETVEFYFYSAISISCLYLILITFYKRYIISNWIQELAEIDHIYVGKETQGKYLSGGKDKVVKSLNLQYTYTVSGKTYIGNKLSLIDDLPIFSNYDKRMHLLLNGLLLNSEKITIYINPKNHKNSLISQKLERSKISVLAMISIAFFLLSINKLSALEAPSILICLVLLAPVIIIESIIQKKSIKWKR